MRDRIISAISACSFVAAIIIFSWWLLYHINPESLSIPPSGWWWFGCSMGGIFFSELKD